jgi:hypothetical protein
MRTIISLFFGLLFSLGLFSQNCTEYIPTETGKTLKYEFLDKKNKPDGYYLQKTLEINQTGIATEFVVETSNYDKKDNMVSEVTLTYTCEDNKFKVDMMSLIDPSLFAQYEETNITINADNIYFPANMVQGDKLNDGFIEMVITNQEITLMTIRVDVTDRIVEAYEDITVPAGTFKAYKITSNFENKAGFIKTQSSQIQWIVKGIGHVKSEAYNKKGKLISTSQLSEIIQ